MPPPIFLVEDDPFLSDALKDYFSAEGFELRLAVTATEARRKIQSCGERVVILVDPVTISLDGAWIRKMAADGHVVVMIAVAIHSTTRRDRPDGSPGGGPTRRVLSPESLVQMVHEILDPSRISALAA